MIAVRQFPIYWGIETQAPDRSLITRATLHEVLPPFRQSVWAFRIRVSPWHWLHVGRFKYDSEVRRWGMDTPVDEISTWRGPHVGPEEDVSDTAEQDQVRQALGNGADRLPGSGDAPDGGTVQGVQPQRLGQGVVGSGDGVTSPSGVDGD